MDSGQEKILVIKLGALGDLVFCFQAFHEIRRAHPDAEIALLTRPPYVEFARRMPWFDKIIVEKHPRFWSLSTWLELRKEIRVFGPSLVYDLQGKKRQSVLFALLGGPLGPAWSGAAPLCKYPRPWPPVAGMHFTDFLAAQLRAAGVPQADPPDLSWFDAPIGAFTLPQRYAVLIPGCSPKALHKRWPPPRFAELSKALRERGLASVTVGTKDDTRAVAGIKALAPDIIDLCGQTSLFELAGILRHAAVVVGNDTGPMHIAAALGAPTCAVFSGKSNPVWSRPHGANVQLRQNPDLADLGVVEVLAAVDFL